MKESEIQKAIINYLRSEGVYCQRINSGSILQKKGSKTYRIKLADKGTPDIIACIKGKFVGFEVKAGEEEVEEWNRRVNILSERNVKSYHRELDQYMNHMSIVEAGGSVQVVGSVKDVENILMIKY